MSSVARWGTVLGVGSTSALLALWLRSIGVFSAGAAMIALRASAVPFGTPPSLGAIGPDLPPLPILLAMPLAVVPQLRWDPLAPALIGAFAAGATAWWLFRALRGFGLNRLASGAIVLGVAAHPVWAYAVASGSGSVLASALLVLALRLHAAWRRTGVALLILGSAFAMALAGLARYDLFVVGLAIAALIALGPRALPREPKDERPAFSIAYAAAVGGALGLWLVVTGLLRGDPFAFVAAGGEAFAVPPTAEIPVHALLVLIPAVVLAAAVTAVRPASATAVAAATIAASAIVTSAATGSHLSLDGVLPLVPLTGLLAGELAASRAWLRAGLALAVPAIWAAGGLALALSPDQGEGHRALIDAVRGSARPMWVGERDVAAAVSDRGGRVLIDERIDAIVALLVRPSQRVVPMGPIVAATTVPPADLVLVRTPIGRGTAHRVAAAWPTLYDGRAPWASLVGTWPVSGEAAEYRLYAVAR